MGPELLAPQRFGFKNSRPTKPSDCYALGMVIYETISGNLPFHKHSDLTVFVKVLEGEHPSRGVRFTESLWKMLELCWTPQPNDRPSIEGVLRCLEAVSNLPEPPSGVDEELTEDSDDRDSATSFSGAQGGAGDATMTELSAATSSELSYFTGHLPSPVFTAPGSPILKPITEADVDSLSREGTDPDLPTSWIDSSRGGTDVVSST